MIRTVIAEDELPLLRGLGQMIEQADPRFQIVCSAKNGKEALEYLTQHRADVLFTDINMPLLSGLELIEQAQRLDPRLTSVILSGYSEFEYARQAIKLGVKNYLLKPVDRGELGQILNTAAEEITRGSYAQKRSALIELLFCGNGQPARDCAWKPLTVLYLCQGAYQGGQAADELPKPGALSDGVMWDMIRKRWACPDLWLFYGQRPNEAIWLLEDERKVSLADVQSLAEERLQAKLPLTVATAEQVPLGELKGWIDRLHQWIAQGAVLGESRLLHTAPAAPAPALSLADKSGLRVAIQKQRWDDFTLQVQRIASHAQGHGETQASLEQLLTTILQMVLEETEAGADRDAETVIHELVGSCDDRQALFGAFFDYSRDLFRHSVFDVSDKNALMQSIAKHIQDHISEPLSLKQLSARFGLVAPYLSKLFKAYTGMSPAQYIQSIRIETAKRMLVEHPTMLSKDIAEQLGYSSPLYFSKTFYRNVGVYPSEYRAQNAKE